MLTESKIAASPNESIAFILGFKKWVGHKTNGRYSGLVQWDYPEEYKHLQVSVPETSIPNFTSLIDQALKFNNQVCEFSHYMEYVDDTN